jgi:hypothetical protein
MSPSEGWQTIALGTVLSFCVPPHAQERQTQPVDSHFGVIEGEGYQIVYDYGPFSENVDAYRDRPGYSVSKLRIGTREAKVATFEDREGNPDFPFARLLRVEDGSSALALRISCSEEATCSLADVVFESLKFK